jgi:hypothetical protein
MKLGLYVVHKRYAAAPMIASRTRHALLKFAFAIDYGSAAIGQL